MHVSLDHYLLVLRQVLPGELILQQAHNHLLEACTVCREEWGGEPIFKVGFAVVDGPHRGLPKEIHYSLTAYDEQLRQLQRMRAIARAARQDLWRIRQQPMESWPNVVVNATKRFRSQAFLLLLVDEARAVVRNSPREAAALVQLVAVVLDQDSRRSAQPWAWDLRARAAAHHANALRVAGNLADAEQRFVELYADTRVRPVNSADVEAEIRSLEATLRMEQGLFSEASELLEGATALASGELAVRIALKRANLLMVVGDAVRALEQFEDAGKGIDSTREALLHLSVVAGRINCLCDLDRAEEAGQLLTTEGQAFKRKGDGHLLGLYDFYQARVDLGLEHLGRAERGFAAARDQLLKVGRDYDAIRACLYLAETLLAAGRFTEVHNLAVGLLPLFGSRGVGREALASLQLLAEAAKGQGLTVALVEELRRKIQEGAIAAVPASSS